ncbi:hypothetical protein [Nonomuraea sp. NPDC050540]|uniref:hypothetical protein n=1 Tax=Nonomuraea sp. NPDC050540 TaxID=3364367 RepID=UPI0037B9C4AA
MNRLWYPIGCLLVVAGLFHLGLLVVDGGPWDGPVGWRKPFTFGLSFGLSVLTLAWVTGLVRLRGRTWLMGAFTAASVAEVSLITLQAWRGVPSHFNLETPLDALIARTLAAGGGVLIVSVVVMTVAAFRRHAEAPPAMLLAVRAGFVTLLLAMASGGVMIARGLAEVMSGDPRTAYLLAGSLKPAHAVLMHGILLLPALAWLVADLSVVRLAVWIYAAFSAVVSGLALAGITVAGPSTASVLAAGAVSGLGIGALALARIRA